MAKGNKSRQESEIRKLNLTMEKPSEQNDSQDDEFLPSYLGSWRRLYAIVLGTLLALIIIFYLMTIFLS